MMHLEKDIHMPLKQKFKLLEIKKQIAVAKENLEIYLHNTIIQTSDQETHVHVGIKRNIDGCNSSTVESRIKSARRTSYSLMGAGYHGINGTGPETSKHLL